MAIRYLAIYTQDDRQRQDLRARISERVGWPTVFSGRHLLVHANADAITLNTDAGVVIGHLFSRTSPPRAIQGGTMIEAHPLTGRLLKDFWGGYVALTDTETPEGPFVLRDPSGIMPCHYIRVGHTTVVASDADALFLCELIQPEIDDAFLARMLCAPDLRSPRTGLMGVMEVMAGHRLKLAGSGPAETVWTPWQFVDPDPDVSPQEMSAQLREVVQSSLQAWAQSYTHVLSTLSGGLDSSIVTTCLAHSGTRLTAMNIATDDAEGDERAYARLVAEATRTPLLEVFHDLSDIDLMTATSAHLPRPVQPPYGQSANAHRWATISRLGIDAFINGIGGDNVFCHHRSAAAVVDRVRSEGLTPRIMETVADLCEMTGCSAWDVVQGAIKRGLKPARYVWKGLQGFLTDEAFADVGEDLYHPWLEAPAKALPGKATHVAMLTRIQGTVDGFPRDLPPEINPLLSQPIVEMCLRIPTWHWCRFGQDRSVAREAFRDVLPPEIVNRRSKGTPGAFVFQIVECNTPLLRERLVNGHLARLHLIDTVRLEASLARPTQMSNTDAIQILLLSETEAWIDHWRARRQTVYPQRKKWP
jgi:asparagine synthase (glutamine-hydrolysing)